MSHKQVELVVANTVSRLGCTVGEARRILAEQSGNPLPVAIVEPVTQAEAPAPEAAVPEVAPISPVQEEAPQPPTSKRNRKR